MCTDAYIHSIFWTQKWSGLLMSLVYAIWSTAGHGHACSDCLQRHALQYIDILDKSPTSKPSLYGLTCLLWMSAWPESLLDICPESVTKWNWQAREREILQASQMVIMIASRNKANPRRIWPDCYFDSQQVFWVRWSMDHWPSIAWSYNDGPERPKA